MGAKTSHENDVVLSQPLNNLTLADLHDPLSKIEVKLVDFGTGARPLFEVR